MGFLEGLDLLPAAISLVIAYLLGSFNFAIIVSKSLIKEDVREKGSGNAGMTNILRNYGKGYAAITIIGDFLKGIAAVIIGNIIFSSMTGSASRTGAYLAGIGVLLGHVYPLYFGFKGGKGVVTAASVLFMTEPSTLYILLPVFLIICFTVKIVSVASISCAALYPFVTLGIRLMTKTPLLPDVIFAAVIAIFVIYMHRQNIRNLLNGTERKFGSKKAI